MSRIKLPTVIGFECAVRRFRIVLIGAGLLSLIWFLVRVIPKPRRAAYPCQRAVAPLASGFVIWLLSLVAAMAAWRKGKEFSRRSRHLLAWSCVCGKNHYGSLLRTPVGALRGVSYPDCYDLHLSLPNAEWSPGMGQYRATVDLMSHRELGGKTLLYLVDGLFGGYYWDARPYPWKSALCSRIWRWPDSLLASRPRGR